MSKGLASIFADQIFERKSYLMLEVNRIRTQYDDVLAGLRKRNWPAEQLALVDEILTTDEERKNAQKALDELLAKRNVWSKEIGDLMRNGQKDAAEVKKSAVNQLNAETDLHQNSFNEAKEKLQNLLLQVPNVPYRLVPPGHGAEDNEVYKAWTSPIPTDKPIPHWDLAKKYNLIDFELGVKITGSGFPIYRGKGAKLERALINFFLDEAVKAGYEEILPPLMVNEKSARGTGQLPDKEDQMYYVGKDDFYLIPTAEVPVTNIYREVIIPEQEFPIKLTAYTPCFRREAGSYGAHVKGLNRLHQFDKVEIVRFEHPDASYHALDEMLGHVEGLLTKLELPYRILRLCGGDMGFASAMTFDFEVYSVAQGRWLEVSSVSNFETFQTNRMQTRFKTKDGRVALAHPLNGSALALARIVAAILELYQEPDGIQIPQVLIPFMGCERIA